MGAYPGYNFHMLKFSTWVLTREWALAWDTMVATHYACQCIVANKLAIIILAVHELQDLDVHVHLPSLSQNLMCAHTLSL